MKTLAYDSKKLHQVENYRYAHQFQKPFRPLLIAHDDPSKSSDIISITVGTYEQLAVPNIPLSVFYNPRAIERAKTNLPGIAIVSTFKLSMPTVQPGLEFSIKLTEELKGEVFVLGVILSEEI